MTTSAKLATAYSEDGGGIASWYEPQKAMADDGQRAHVNLPREVYSPGLSNYLNLHGYAFEDDIAPGYEVTDVTITVEISAAAPLVGTSLAAQIQWWNGTTWQSVNLNTYQVFSLSAGSGFVGPVSYSIGAVSLDVIAAWAGDRAFRIRCHQATNTAIVAYLDRVTFTVTYTPPAAPTVTAITPAAGSVDGGTSVTITGTGFQTDDDEDPQALVSGVTIGGVACTEVDVLSATSLTCKTGAHAAGAVNVVVTNAGGDGTLTNGFTYLSVVDAVVKVVKGGAVSGSSLHVATAWPASPGEQTYGGPTELWSALTIADVNASNFGFVLGATVGAGAQARVDFMAARFYYTVQGLSDPASFLAVLHVEEDRQTARPELYQLPRSGFSISNDPSIDRRLAAAAEFRCSRRYAPGRTIEKICYNREFHLTETANGANTPGLQVWARMDDGAAFQLEDAAGNPATLRGSGPKEVFFPKGDIARCYYWQILYRVPEPAVGEVPAAYTIRDGVTRILVRPKRARVVPFTLILGGGEFEDRTSMKLSAAQQLEKLLELTRPGKPSVEIRDPQGRVEYGSVIGLEYREMELKGGPRENVLVANVKLRVARYE